jgi:CRISPR/Cas system-associated protein Csx1
LAVLFYIYLIFKAFYSWGEWLCEGRKEEVEFAILSTHLLQYSPFNDLSSNLPERRIIESSKSSFESFS